MATQDTSTDTDRAALVSKLEGIAKELRITDIEMLTEAGSGHPGGTFLLSPRTGQASSWETARRASASRTPQLISCSVRTEGDWS